MDIITSHFPVEPQSFFADSSKKTSEYSITVSQSLIFSTESDISNLPAFLIIVSLNNTNKLERQ